FRGLAPHTVAKGRTAVVLEDKHPDAVAGLRLGTARTGPVWRRALRAGLLAASPVFTEPRVVRLATWLERIGVRRLTLFYELSLDYLYWLGVKEARVNAAVEARAEGSR